jgi:hypothetical protein
VRHSCASLLQLDVLGRGLSWLALCSSHVLSDPLLHAGSFVWLLPLNAGSGLAGVGLMIACIVPVDRLYGLVACSTCGLCTCSGCLLLAASFGLATVCCINQRGSTGRKDVPSGMLSSAIVHGLRVLLAATGLARGHLYSQLMLSLTDVLGVAGISCTASHATQPSSTLLSWLLHPCLCSLLHCRQLSGRETELVFSCVVLSARRRFACICTLYV